MKNTAGNCSVLRFPGGRTTHAMQKLFLNSLPCSFNLPALALLSGAAGRACSFFTVTALPGPEDRGRAFPLLLFPRLSRPFLTGPGFLTPRHRGCSSLNLLQLVCVLLKRCRLTQDSSSGLTRAELGLPAVWILESANTAQHRIRLLCRRLTLLALIQWAVH